LPARPRRALGPRLAGLFRIGFQTGEEVSARLEAIDRDPGRIDLIINSHFHFDHVGGNALIPNATMLVPRREWDAGMDPDTAARRDFDLGHKLRLLAVTAAAARSRGNAGLARHRLEALEKSGARIYFSHDPDFWRSVPQAPAAIA